MPDHDHSYKLLFSHPRMVKDLLTGFVKEDWVKELDFDSLEKLNQSYITDDLRERADDVVWRVRFRDQWLYVYLLLEFQSTIDPFMAVRLLSYVGLLYQDLIKTGQLPQKHTLPPVLPLVLYNGEQRWTAAQSVQALLPELPEQLRHWQPALHYRLIDEGRYSEAELERLENLVAALIRAENSPVPEKLARVIGNLIVWLEGTEQTELRRAFKTWFERVLLPHRLPGQRIGQVNDLTEVQTMLAERVKEWTKEWKQEGLDEGMQRGKLEGEAEVVKRLLTKRFGPLPGWAVERLESASANDLERWAEGIFEAGSLEGFFQG